MKHLIFSRGAVVHLGVTSCTEPRRGDCIVVERLLLFGLF